MVSQLSNVGSDGVPFDQDGASLEFGVGLDGEDMDVLGNGLARSEEAISLEEMVGENSHSAKSQATSPSSLLGGIRVERGSDDDTPVFETAAEAIHRETIHMVAKTTAAANNEERKELAALRHKIIDIQNVLKTKGISWVQLEMEALQAKDKFNSGLPSDFQILKGRADNELPKTHTGGKVADVLSKGPKSILKKTTTVEVPKKVTDCKVGEEAATTFRLITDENGRPVLKNTRNSLEAPQLFDNIPHLKPSEVGVSGAKDSKGCPVSEAPVKANAIKSSWSQVVKTTIPVKPSILKLDFVPLPEGSRVVSPPIEVLKKGNDKLKLCLVGSFTKNSLPFGRVLAFARSAWKKKEFVSVSQKDNNTYIFKFASEVGMNDVLSQGTWYIGNVPMLVHQWGVSITADKVKKLPLWVKFEHVPDCYWTKEGLSNLASAVGPPLYADELTSKLEILPFARICVDYTIGDTLPTSIEVIDLDPCTEESHHVTVKVSYPTKPRICSACHSLGHIAGACPKASLVDNSAKTMDTVSNVVNEGNQGNPVVENKGNPVVVENKGNPVVENKGNPVVVNEDNPVADIPVKPSINTPDSEWKTVTKKRSFSPTAASEESPSPLNTFKNLAQVDEVEAKQGAPKLSKSQLKKQKKALKASGSSPLN